jgi:hypothetical protein
MHFVGNLVLKITAVKEFRKSVNNGEIMSEYT